MAETCPKCHHDHATVTVPPGVCGWQSMNPDGSLLVCACDHAPAPAGTEKKGLIERAMEDAFGLPAPARMSEEEFERLAGWLHGPKDEYGPDRAIAEKFLAEARGARKSEAALREEVRREKDLRIRYADEANVSLRSSNQRADAAEADRERLWELLARAEPWLGIDVDVDDDEEDYKLVDRLRADIRAALGEEKK